MTNECKPREFWLDEDEMIYYEQDLARSEHVHVIDYRAYVEELNKNEAHRLTSFIHLQDLLRVNQELEVMRKERDEYRAALEAIVERDYPLKEQK